MGKHNRRLNGEELSLERWVGVGLRVLDEIEAAAKRDEAPVEVRHRLGDAVIALHDVRRMVPE